MFDFRKHYPEIRQENRMFTERLDESNRLINEKTKEKNIILTNLRRGVGLVTETLKVGDDKDKNTLVSAGQQITGNLFKQLYDILISKDDLSADEQQQQQTTDKEMSRSLLSVK